MRRRSVEGVRWPRLSGRSLVVTAAALGAVLASGPAAGDPGDDGVPVGTVAFFGSAGGTCPVGWAPAAYVAGRMVVGVAATTGVGVEVGTALGDQEDRTHEHAWSTSVELAYKSISAADGSNDQGAAAQSYPQAGTTGPSTSGLPFIQMLACERQ